MLQRQQRARASKILAFVILGLGTISAGLGCGSKGEGEIEIPIPVHNPSNTGPMSGIDESNEAQHLDKLRGSMAPR